LPCERVGHSAVMKNDPENGDCMYIFGGKDEENNKLNDTWKFNFTTLQWTFIECFDEPLARSGHSASIFRDNFMIIYGGIYEVTKELNDMHVFDLANDKWICLFEEINSPKKYGNNDSPTKSANLGHSPILRASTRI